MAARWEDDGPISQGKIITKVLQHDLHGARELLRGWSYDDLWLLSRAVRGLEVLIAQEQAGRWRRE